MWLQIDPLAPEPLFRQVCAGIKAAVARGRLVAGQRLPSVRELAQELAINPNTVAKAYGELEHEGVIVRRQGAGCFVTDGDRERSAESRQRELARLAERLAIESFHLGCEPAALRAALEAAIAGLSGASALAGSDGSSGESQEIRTNSETYRGAPRSLPSPDAERRAS